MIMYFNFSLSLLLGLLFSTSLLNASLLSAHAEELLTAQVEVEHVFNPTHAIGMLISKDGVVTKTIKDTKPSALPGRMIVTFPYLASELKEDTLAGAMLEYEVDGNRITVFANLRPLYKSTKKGTHLELPMCPPELPQIRIASGAYGTLKGLIELRSEKRDLSKSEVESNMSGFFLSRLDQLESDLGLLKVTPLSPDLNPIELIDRLQRLHHGLMQNAARIKQEQAKLEKDTKKAQK